MVTLYSELEVEHRWIKVRVFMPTSLEKCFLKTAILLADKYLGFFVESKPSAVHHPFRRILHLLLGAHLMIWKTVIFTMLYVLLFVNLSRRRYWTCFDVCWAALLFFLIVIILEIFIALTAFHKWWWWHFAFSVSAATYAVLRYSVGLEALDKFALLISKIFSNNIFGRRCNFVRNRCQILQVYMIIVV